MDDDRHRRAASPPEPGWGGWDEARKRKFTLGLAATPAERLAWLEQAIELAFASGALPRTRAPTPWGR